MNGRTLNSIHLIGYVGSEPAVRWYDSETCSARFSLATNAESHLTEDVLESVGAVTDWHRVVCYRQLAEEVGTGLQKGDLVELQGRLTYSRSYNKQGKFVTHTFVIARELRVLERAKARQSKPAEEAVKERYARYFDELDKGDEGLPF